MTGRDVIGRGLRVLWAGVRHEPKIFTIATIGSILFGLLTIGTAYALGYVVGHVVEPAFATKRYEWGTLLLAAGLVLAVSAGKVIGIFGRRLGSGFMQFRLQAAYRRKVTRRYLELPPAWHARHSTGSLLSNANSDVEATWWPIAPLPFAIGSIVMMFAAVVVLFFTDWVLALVGLAVFPALFTLNVVYSRRMAPRQAKAQSLRAAVSGIAHESFDGALVVKTMGREQAETERFAAKARELRDALIRVGRLRGVFDPSLESLPSVGTLAVLVAGAWRVKTGAIDLQELISVTLLFTVMAFPVRSIGWVLGELPRSVAGWDRVQRVLTATGEMAYGESGVPGSGAAEIAFDRVDFAYVAGEPVLHDVTFKVKPGKTVALVGPTGSGKSTVATLAARLLDPDSGEIRLGGVPAPSLAAADLAQTVALVPQLSFAFDDTVRANVTLDRQHADGTPISDEEAWAALATAQVKPFVERLPEGLDTELGERGTTLSGGQRQRLVLARALAGKPRVLILDDATSAVDPRVEAAILRSLRSGTDSGTGGATILVVAYRRATIALADEVVYLEQGRVVAHGTHTQLLESVPGYAGLVTAYEKAEAERDRSYDAEEPEDDLEEPDTAMEIVR
ncbi:MAG: ABC transporter ATP-binding protein [Hamadaea sp.]|uniref:ABC transporter ATP-binding protein n=1 Tax=Hamadaea sp. TaxID=2024425 RepID=UPI0018373677|nr:ABC transporter ATP-binding protein [Hamadaea sp.]NUR70054.1 ABC transporter ATP-binding protein [Hamadaea sp.]NUT21598.1 ABC transporter ATP-binding protein [Hamadaea sp.]